VVDMQNKDEQLRQALLKMKADDLSLREELASDGSLFEGYHPRMRQLHEANAEMLLRIIRQYGWPGRSLVGEDGAEAAWLIAQHAISLPRLQRQARALIEEAARRGEAQLWQAAMLEDRIRMFEGRPQLYGTQFDWDENGEMSPYPEIEEEAKVDERRSAVGLGPLGEDIKSRRAAIRQTVERTPSDIKQRRKEMDEWARAVGWRD
ncbi:MAG TPA: DUF6624 domain-containing protein, partial [Blastocatellia bacterium]|nr:DUF6624 domain-containing protein [Blastocatellia bacterium]